MPIAHEMQYVEVEFDPGESAVAEAGSLIYKDVAVEMTTVFGDGSNQPSGGFMDLLVGAGTILALDLEQFGGKLICQKDAFLAAAKGVSIGIAFQ